MKDIENSMGYFIEKLWSSVGIPERYLRTDHLERIMIRRKRIKNLKDIYINGKTRD